MTFLAGVFGPSFRDAYDIARFRVKEYFSDSTQGAIEKVKEAKVKINSKLTSDLFEKALLDFTRSNELVNCAIFNLTEARKIAPVTLADISDLSLEDLKERKEKLLEAKKYTEAALRIFGFLPSLKYLDALSVLMPDSTSLSSKRRQSNGSDVFRSSPISHRESRINHSLKITATKQRVQKHGEKIDTAIRTVNGRLGERV